MVWNIKHAVAIFGTLTVGGGHANGTIVFGSDGDLLFGRGAANRLDLGTGDTLRISTTGALQFGSDISMSRNAANDLRMAAGDRFVGNPLNSGGGSALTANGDVGFSGSTFYYRTGGSIFNLTPDGTIAI